MADELQVQVNVTYSNGSASNSFTPGTVKLPQVTQGMNKYIVTVNSSAEETISFSDVTTPSMVHMRSMEATSTGNFVTYGPDSTGMIAFGQLGPKDVHVLRLTSTGPTLKAQADTAAVNIEITAYEL
jgi:hypothetical protein